MVSVDGGEVGDGAAGFVGGEVLEDFDAGDEVVVRSGKGLRDGGDAAEGRKSSADVRDGEFGDVGAPGLDAAVAEGFDQEAECAAGVEDGFGVQVSDEGVGDGTGRTRANIRCARRVCPQPVAVVFGVVGGSTGFTGKIGLFFAFRHSSVVLRLFGRRPSPNLLV